MRKYYDDEKNWIKIYTPHAKKQGITVEEYIKNKKAKDIHKKRYKSLVEPYKSRYYTTINMMETKKWTNEEAMRYWRTGKAKIPKYNNNQERIEFLRQKAIKQWSDKEKRKEKSEQMKRIHVVLTGSKKDDMVKNMKLFWNSERGTIAKQKLREIKTKNGSRPTREKKRWKQQKNTQKQ